MDFVKRFAFYVGFILCFMVLTSCRDTANDTQENTAVAISGSVSDGPISGGTVTVSSSSGTVLETGQTDDQGNYVITLDDNNPDNYPLLIASTGGIDLVTNTTPDFTLHSIAMAPDDKRANLNPYTTLITKSAERLPGGLIQANIQAAKERVQQKLNFGFDPALLENPFVSTLSDTNVAMLLKSGEAVGEALRRTRDAIQLENANISSDDIVLALAADLTDGIIDGQGATGSDPRIAAVNTIVSGQVVLESLQNQLKVLGVDSTDKTDEVIKVLFPESSVSVRNVAPTVAALKQAEVALAAAQAMEDNETINLILASLIASEDNSSLQDRVNQLPANAGESLNGSIALTIDADETQLELINKTAREGRFIPIESNTPPTISGVAPTRIEAGSMYLFVPQASDVDGEALIFSIANKPAWADFDEVTGALTGRPNPGHIGRYESIAISVTDGNSTVALTFFTIEVIAPVEQSVANRKPVISGTPPVSVKKGENYHFVPQARDDDADALLFTIGNKPGWATFDVATGSLIGKPGSEDAAVYTDIVINVTDGRETASLPPFDITVVNTNIAPTISGIPATTVMEGEFYQFIPQASDTEGDSLTFIISNKPDWATFDTITGTLSGKPSTENVGKSGEIIISVKDASATTALPPFIIQVTAIKEEPVTNVAPSISGMPATTVQEGIAYEFTPQAGDPDGDTLFFVISNKPNWAKFDVKTGALMGTPGSRDVGRSSKITISVTDGEETVKLLPFIIEVTAIEKKPIISGTPNTRITVGAAYQFIPQASDANGDSLTFTIKNAPNWSRFDTTTGMLSGMPSSGDIGIVTDIIISVTDDKTTSSLPSFSIAVVAAPVKNNKPIISGIPAATIVAEVPYQFVPQASDADGDKLTFAIANAPSWINFDAATGALNGTPGSDDVGIATDIIISVTDDKDTSSLPSFSINVVTAPVKNNKPIISGIPAATVVAEVPYQFVPQASDADGDKLTFAIANAPSWINFDVATGALNGTPSSDDAGITTEIIISVTDDKDTSSLPSFSIEVVAAPVENKEPTISGLPEATVVAGTAYSFVPQASDADGDKLTFAIANAPSWINFDVATGALNGTPSSDDAGITTDIIISVTDDKDTSSLPSFSIEVVAAPVENSEPIISGIPEATVVANTTYSFVPQASDADDDKLTFTIANAPSWINFDAATGTIEGTPENSDVGLFENLVITVTDGDAIATLPTFSIEVLEPISSVKLWSDPKTWGGTVPVAGDDVEIKTGMEVLLDEDTANLENLKISGKLVFDKQDLQLTAESILVEEQGELWIGSEMEPFNNKALITLTGNDRTKESILHSGSKALVVMGGQLQLHGRKKLSWTRLSSNANIGDTEIELEKAPDWQVGDRIAIASTDFNFEQAEQRIITAVTGTRVSFDEPLQFLHWGELQNFGTATIDQRAEVGLLTRNITIQGDEGSDASRYGGHVMVHGGGGSAQVSGVAFFRMGQEGLLARYPYHWHMGGDRSGDYFNDNSIYNSYQRCVSVHGTHNVELKSNVAYEITSHCYFLEDGIETGNLFDSNLGMVVRRPKKDVALLPSDFAGQGASVFWISNPDNTFRNNVAAGAEGSGFWIALAEHPSGLSATDSVWLRNTPLKEFFGNVSHSNGADGLHVDSGPKSDPQAGQEVAPYRPSSELAAIDQFGKNTSAPVVAIFDNFTAYKNRNRGVWLRGTNHLLRGAKLSDNAIGATFASHESFATNSVFIGETTNLGTATSFQIRNNRVGENNRTLPKPSQADFPIRGFEFYDGKVGVESSYFDKFEPTEQRQAGGLSVLDFTDFNFSPKNYAKDLTWAAETNRVYLATRAVPASGTAGEDGYRSAVIFDEDGSTTGTAGQNIVVNNPFLIKQNSCDFVDSWNAYECSLQYVNLRFINRDKSLTNIAPLEISREDGISHTMLGTPSSKGITRFTANINAADRYHYSLASRLPDYSRLYLKKGAGDADAVSVSLPFNNATAYVYQNGIRANTQLQPVKSLAELDNSSGEVYYLSGSRLHLKLQIPSEKDDAALEICKKEFCR